MGVSSTTKLILLALASRSAPVWGILRNGATKTLGNHLNEENVLPEDEQYWNRLQDAEMSMNICPALFEFFALEVMYNETENACFLKWKIDEDCPWETKRVDDSVIFSDGNDTVTCQEMMDKPFDNIELKLDAEIDPDNATWTPRSRPVKSAKVEWDIVEDYELTVIISKVGENDFDEVSLRYDDYPSNKTVTFKYELNGIEHKIVFEGDEVKESGSVVYFEKCVEVADDITLPWYIDFEVEKEVLWVKSCGDDDPERRVSVGKANFTISDIPCTPMPTPMPTPGPTPSMMPKPTPMPTPSMMPKPTPVPVLGLRDFNGRQLNPPGTMASGSKDNCFPECGK